ncbi:MAG: UvrB/UvrC motif-containing protein [Candidatus Acidiferrales bacterium]|jgi:excinuclease UvrABC nuclease subunit
MLELDGVQEFDAAGDSAFFRALPACPGVLLLEMANPRAEPYLARTADIRRAAERLLRPPEAPSQGLNLRGAAARIRYRATGSKFEQAVTHYQQARAYFPHRYRDLVRIRPPAMLKVSLRNEYPRCYVTRSIRGDADFYFGPFPSRKMAQSFSEEFLDLFKIRRCQIRIRPDPSFPGCMYSQMKMCLAPCFAGCTKQEYDAEVGRALKGLELGGAPLIQDVEREREAASEALDFERAAALHKQLEKISAVLRGLPELTRRVEELDAVILQRAAEEKTVAAFPVGGGLLSEPIFLRFAKLSSEPTSVEAILRAGLNSPGDDPPRAAGKNPPATSGDSTKTTFHSPEEHKQRYRPLIAPPELSEHLSLLTRWFYSNPREGEIFFRGADWPYRRILRACGRLLAPPQGPGAPAGPSSRHSRDRLRRLNAFSKLDPPSKK